MCVYSLKKRHDWRERRQEERWRSKKASQTHCNPVYIIRNYANKTLCWQAITYIAIFELWTGREVDNFTEDLSAIQQVLHRSNNITDIGHPLRKIIPFGHLSQLQLQVIIFSSPLQQDCDMCSELPGVPADLQHWSSQINPPNWTLANLVAQTGCKTEQACLRIHKICMVYLQYQ